MARSSIRLTLRVLPGAGRSEVVGRHGGAWKVRVGAAPERGRANAALVRLLARQLRIPRSEITIVSGHAGRDKVVELGGLSVDEAASRLLEECERV
jgi:uncharacterized protein (TIGR00251 family)